MADGATFEINIEANGQPARDAADAVTLMTSRLEAASAASDRAAEAVKAGQAAYNQAETAANRAAVALEKVTLAADEQAGKLKAALDVGDLGAATRAQEKFNALTQRQAELAAKSSAAKAALDAEAASLDRLKGAAAQAADNQKKAAAAHDQAAKAAAATDAAAKAAAGSGKVNEIAEGLGKLGGPLGVAGQKAFGAAEGFKKLSASLGSAGPYVAIAVAVAAIAVGFVALGVAAAVAGAKIAIFAVSNADAARTQGLLYEGMARSAKGGEELGSKIRMLHRATGLENSELDSMAKNLADGGLRGKALTDALQTAAVKAAKLKFGPDFAKRLLSTDFQLEILKENLDNTFSIGKKSLEPLLKALSTLVMLFDSSEETGNASGRAIQSVFRGAFEPLIGAATDVIPKLRTAFIQMEIAFLKGLIQLKGVTKQWYSELRVAALVVGGILVGALVAVVVVVALVVANLALLGAAITVVLGVIVAGTAGIVAMALAFVDFGRSAIASVTSAVDTLRSMSLLDIGTAMIDGLVQGITNSSAKVASALKGVVDGAVNTAKQALGIKSPSKVFAEIGGYTAEGMEQGVTDGASGVQRSVADMVAPPEAKGGAGGNAKSSGDQSGGGVTIIIHGVEGATEMLKELEAVALKLGAGLVPAT